MKTGFVHHGSYPRKGVGHRPESKTVLYSDAGVLSPVHWAHLRTFT